MFTNSRTYTNPIIIFSLDRPGKPQGRTAANWMAFKGVPCLQGLGSWETSVAFEPPTDPGFWESFVGLVRQYEQEAITLVFTPLSDREGRRAIFVPVSELDKDGFFPALFFKPSFRSQNMSNYVQHDWKTVSKTFAESQPGYSMFPDALGHKVYWRASVIED
jgi:hypothetical protein